MIVFLNEYHPTLFDSQILHNFAPILYTKIAVWIELFIPLNFQTEKLWNMFFANLGFNFLTAHRFKVCHLYFKVTFPSLSYKTN